MSERTKIEWCDHTFNPWIGCAKVSPGCKNCYAETLMATRYGKVQWGKGAERKRTSAANWKLPMKWNKMNAGGICKTCGKEFASCVVASQTEKFFTGCDTDLCDGSITYRRPRVFCASLADWLDDEVPIEWLAHLIQLAVCTPNLDWLLLTKRPENFRARVEAASCVLEDFTPWTIADWLDGDPPPNIWIGTSVEDQQRADERIPELLKIPARVRFLSVEPLLERVDLSKWVGIHLVIYGGESGPGARPCNVEWIRDGVRQCRAAGVAPFVKQLGADVRCDNANEFDWPDDAQLEAAGEAFASCRVRLQDKKGGDMSEWPEDLRVREFPEVREVAL